MATKTVMDDFETDSDNDEFDTDSDNNDFDTDSDDSDLGKKRMISSPKHIHNHVKSISR